MAAKNTAAFALQILARKAGVDRCLEKAINVPDLPINFISREQDFDVVKKALLSKDNTTIGITGRKFGQKKFGLLGLGGIGKTVLAAALAKGEDVGKHFPDGIFWLTLGQQPDIVNRQL